MSLSEQFNVGARITAKMATTSLSISQTSNTAATTQDGLTIDRLEAGLKRYYSCKSIAAFAFLAASSATVASVSINFQHSSDGTSWDNYSTATVPTAVTFGTTAGGSTDYDTVEQSVNLVGARRYVRMQISTPTFAGSSSGQGVFSGGGILVFGGGDELPAR
jgi:hypothetical protein